MPKITLSIMRRKFLLFFILTAILIVLCTPFIVRQILNTSTIKNKITALVSEKTGFHIAPSAISISFLPSPQCTLTDISIPAGVNADNSADISAGINNGSQVELKIGSLTAEMELQSLFKGEIRINSIIINNPELSFSPSISIQNTPKKSDLKNSKFQWKKILETFSSFLDDSEDEFEVNIENAVSPFFKRMNSSFVISGETRDISLNADIELLPFNDDKSNGSNGGTISVRCFFNNNLLNNDPLNHNQGYAEINFSGNNIDIEQAGELAFTIFKDSSFVRKLFDILRKGLAKDVQVSFKAKDLSSLFNGENLYLKGSVSRGTVRIPGTSLIVNDIKGKSEIKNNIMDIEVSQGLLGTTAIKQGKLKIDLFTYEHYPFDGDFLLDIDLSMVPKTLISLMPDTQLAAELKKINNIKGSAATNLRLEKPENGGSVKVSFDAPQFTATGNYERIPGTTVVEQSHFRFYDGIAELNNIKGNIFGADIDSMNLVLDFNKDPTINIKSGSGKIALASAFPLILSCPETKKIIHPLKHGSGNIFVNSLNLKGALTDSEKWIYDIKGSAEHIDLTTNIKHKEIKNLAFDFHLHKPNTYKSASDKPAGQTLSQALNQAPAQPLEELLDQPFDQSGTEHFSLRQISADIADLSGFESFIDAKYDKKYLKSIKLPFKFENANFEANKQNIRLNGDIKFPEGIELKIELGGKNFKDLNVKNIALTDPGLSKAYIALQTVNEQSKHIFSGRLNTKSILSICRPESQLYKKITAFTENKPLIIYTDKNKNLNLQITSMDLTPMFISTPQEEPPGALSSELPVKPVGKLMDIKSFFPANNIIQIKSDIMHFKRWTASQVDAQILQEQKRNFTTIILNNAQICGLKASGHIKIDKNDRIDMMLPLKAQKGESIQELLDCFFEKNKLMNGRYTLTGKLEANALKKDITSSLNGSFTIKAQDGRIYKLTLLSRIFSLINVYKLFRGELPDITQQGFAYTKMLVEAEVKHSIIHITKAVIRGKDMTLVFTGKVDPIEDKMDLIVLVAPFKTIDSLLAHIPIVSSLTDGYLITIPVKASGPISDPEVVPLHPSAVGGTILNMMKNIVGAPFRMLDKMLED